MMVGLLLILVWLPAGVLTSTEVAEDCTVRFQDNGVCVCSMENSEGPVKCSNDSQTISIEPCYCVYYDQDLNKTTVGRCYYTCYRHNYKTEVGNSTDFNDDFCQSSHTARTGFFCYECKKPYALAAYSYQAIDCVPCDNYGFKNWMKTLSITLLPLTSLYILSILLSLNITSSSTAGIVLVLQCITSSPLRTYETIFTSTPENSDPNLFVKIVFGIIDMVNLRFFHLLNNPVCLHPRLNYFELSCLEYAVALYPFLLIFLTYLLISAYDRQCRLLVWLWKPFKVCTLHYRKTWNIRTSLLEIFASFILLSSVKIIHVGVNNMLSHTQTYDPFGNKVKIAAPFSANVSYFSSRHLPFALLAIVISFIFVILPLTLLALYPCRCFQKCLNFCGFRLPSLHILMDAFQGSYKLHPRDMRYFSAFYLFLRVVLLLHAEFFLSPTTLYISGIISLVASGIVALFQPYKNNVHNTVDSVLLLLMGIYFISANTTSLVATLKFGGDWIISSIIQAASITLIVLYFIFLIAKKLMYSKILALIQKVKEMNNHPSYENSIIGSFDVHDREGSILAESEADISTPLLSKCITY